MIGKNRLECSRGKRGDFEKAGLASVKRFFGVTEYAVHERVEAAAHDKVDFRPSMVFVPFALHFAEDGGIHAPEILEFVDYQRYRMFAGIAHHPFEDVLEVGLFAGEEHAKFGFYLTAERLAQFLLCTPCDEEVEEGYVPVCMANQFCLSNASTARNYGELCVLQRIRLNLVQY